LKIEEADNAISLGSDMKVLALECATERCSTALWMNGEVRSLFNDGAQQRNSESMLPMISALLKEADIALQALDVIAFGAGPGAFTGLRVACGVAQGLAFGAGLPVLAVGTMDILAEGMRRHLCSQLLKPPEPLRVLTVMDARMGEIYSAELIEEGQDWRVISGPHLFRPEALSIDEEFDYWGIGDGFVLHSDALLGRLDARVRWVDACMQVPDAVPLAQLASYRFQQNGGVPPEEAQPFYVRNKVALTSAERAKA
jgi:tRNA threonylcarbamoyladenosine biosynthesis protein TsaB